MRRLAGWVLSLALMALPLMAWGRILIFITPDRAGPNIDPRSYVHPGWIRWSPAVTPDGTHRLLSLKTGQDWFLPPGDFGFADTGDGWRAQSFDALKARGALKGQTFALVRESVSVNALLMALDESSPVVRPTTRGSGPWVAEARSWDDAARLAATYGRALVVEWPPSRRSLGRYWTLGSGWPNAVKEGDAALTGRDGIDGMMRAREAVGALMNPTSMTLGDPESFGGADRLADNRVRYAPWVLGSLFFAAALVLTAGVWRIGEERRSEALAIATRLLLHAFPGVAMSGYVARAGGGEALTLFMIVAWPVLAVIITTIVGLASRQGPLSFDAALAISTVGMGGYSMLAPAFGSSRFDGVAPEFLGVAAVATCLILLGHVGPVIGAVLALFFRMPHLLAGALGETRARWLAVPLALSMPLVMIVRGGVGWWPYGLVDRAVPAPGVSFGEVVVATLSPGVVGTLSVFGLVALFAPKYFWHVYRRLRNRPRVRRLAWLCLATALCGLWIGDVMSQLPVALWGYALTVVWEGVTNPDEV